MTASPVRASFQRFIAAFSLCLALPGFAALTNFYTGFESAQGYTNGLALAGQQGWSGLLYSTNLIFTNSGSSGNGVAASGLGGSSQAAFIGLTPLPAPYNKFVEISRILELDPVGSGLPMVNFSARTKVVDTTSPSGPWDSFYIDFYNQDDARLFSLKFDNFNLWIAYEVPSGSTNIVRPLVNLTNSAEYSVNVAMNFASNTCSIAFNGALATNNVPLTVNGSVLNLGSVGFLWLPRTTGSPGDNYMLFDDVRVLSTLPFPLESQLTLLKAGGTNAAATVALSGDDGFRFALESSTNLSSWQAVRTNIITSGTTTYTDSSATNNPARFYRARWVP